jgi:hypothetical protein
MVSEPSRFARFFGERRSEKNKIVEGNRIEAVGATVEVKQTTNAERITREESPHPVFFLFNPIFLQSRFLSGSIARKSR